MPILNNEEEELATVDCKDFIIKIICNLDGEFGSELGFSMEKLNRILDSVAPESISPYLIEVHSRIVRELFGR